MQRAQVEESLLQAFRDEFRHDLALLRQEWEQYSPSAATSTEDLADLRRALHTIKGSTRLLGFAGLPQQVHELEEFVLRALASQSKPVGFWDGLADLEEAVAHVLGEVEGSVDLDPSPVNLPLASTGSGFGSAYSFLLAIDDLLALSQQLAAELDLPEQAASQAAMPSGHQAALLVERSKALREEARRMTLVPSSELFAGLTELARRTASENGKSVRVTHQVAPDQLERDMVLGLRPALLHLVGNAVSHGVRDTSGVINFKYQRQATGLLVAVGDNGKGLSREALKQAVLQAGHLDQAQWAALSPSEQLNWIFHPGLSTRQEADLSAGRGMGMAVVAETVARLGGTVEIESSSQGTEFRLLVPMDWNLRSIMRVSSGHQHFAVLSSEIAAVEACAIETQIKVSKLGELSSLLGYPGGQRDGAYRVLLDKPGGRVAIGVDHLGEFEDVLVTPLLGYSGLPSAIVGVTPYGGAAMLVVSLRALLDSAVPAKPGPHHLEPVAQGPLLLVVDDSVTTRTLVSGILRSEGYRVLVAADGKQGLEMARTEGLALIVSDYQMPILDGLGFLESLREDSVTQSMPFILLTSIDDVATFEKASGLGADRCLGKQNFTQELLLKTVRELL